MKVGQVKLFEIVIHTNSGNAIGDSKCILQNNN